MDTLYKSSAGHTSSVHTISTNLTGQYYSGLACKLTANQYYWDIHVHLHIIRKIIDVELGVFIASQVILLHYYLLTLYKIRLINRNKLSECASLYQPTYSYKCCLSVISNTIFSTTLALYTDWLLFYIKYIVDTHPSCVHTIQGRSSGCTSRCLDSFTSHYYLITFT